jgi:hypothetical protein
MNGRVYDPTVGRFLSVDPIVRDAAASQSWNGYGYVEGRLLSATDPTGWVIYVTGVALPRADPPRSAWVTSVYGTFHQSLSSRTNPDTGLEEIINTGYWSFSNPNSLVGLREPSLGAVERPVPSRLANEDAEEPQGTKCEMRDLMSDLGSSIYDFVYQNNLGVEVGLAGVLGNESSGFQTASILVGVNLLGQFYVGIASGELAGRGAVGYVAASVALARHNGPVRNGLGSTHASEAAAYLGVGDAVTVQRSGSSVGVSVPGSGASISRLLGLRAGPGLGFAGYHGDLETGTNVFVGRERPDPSYTGCGGRF